MIDVFLNFDIPSRAYNGVLLEENSGVTIA